MTSLVANCLLHSEYSVQKPNYLNATAMKKHCKQDLKEHYRISSTDLQAEIDQENARVTTICSTDSEFITYLRLILQRSLELDFNLSGQISSVLKSPLNNLSAQ
jgi:hypothetical protein